MKKSGITLIEVLIVIVVIAILAAIIVPRILEAKLRRQEASLKANLAETRAMIDAYKQQHGAYPTTLGALIAEKNQTTTGKPYLYELPIDPFTGINDYNYDATTGKIHSKAEGATLDGTAYKDF